MGSKKHQNNIKTERRGGRGNTIFYSRIIVQQSKGVILKTHAVKFEYGYRNRGKLNFSRFSTIIMRTFRTQNLKRISRLLTVASLTIEFDWCLVIKTVWEGVGCGFDFFTRTPSIFRKKQKLYYNRGGGGVFYRVVFTDYYTVGVTTGYR